MIYRYLEPNLDNALGAKDIVFHSNLSEILISRYVMIIKNFCVSPYLGHQNAVFFTDQCTSLLNTYVHG